MEQLGIILLWIGFICCSISFVISLYFKRYNIVFWVSLFFVILDSITLVRYYTTEHGDDNNDSQINVNTPVISKDDLVEENQCLQIVNFVKNDSVIKSDTTIVYVIEK